MMGHNRLEEGGVAFKLLNSAPRPRELTGSVDLVTHYGLREHYEQFCKKSIPASISETRYLRNVVGGIDIRKGEGMELGQLLHRSTVSAEGSDLQIRLFDIDVLRRAFTFRESGHILLPEADRGMPTMRGIAYDDKEKEKHKHKQKHKKHKHGHKEKHKDKVRDEDKEKNHAGMGENGDDRSRKHRRKKRRHDGDKDDADGRRHRKKKHKQPQVPDIHKNLT